MAYCLQCGHKAEYKIPKGDHNSRIVCPNCNYIHYENPKVICGALVLHEVAGIAKVLLCRRAIEPKYGFWTLPAGFMEIGETIVEGAARETVEEADAIITDAHLYCIYDIPDIGQIYMLYLATLQDGKYGVGSESLECALFDEADIPWDDIAFESVRRTLKHYFHDRQSITTKNIDTGDSLNAKFSDFPLHKEFIGKDKSIKRY